ncbi:MAG: glycosyltransferase family 2 protein [Firmicutes bacterium]|nr:glycosyltransferase family 2 protein [Bacillota bacterium]
MKNKICGVVVFYNPATEALNNINSYLKNIDKLYIVDNTPDKKLEIDNKKIEYIPLMDNKGIAYALNVGAKRALDEGYEWILTMDQDSTFKDNALLKMIKFLVKLKNDKSFSKQQDLSYSKIGVLSPLHLIPQIEGQKYEDVTKPLLVMTSGNLVNLKAYKKIGGFKDWFFIDCVDFDFCLNMRNHGYEVVQLNTAKLNHSLGETQKKKIFNKTCFVGNHSATRMYYMARNRLYLYDLYHDTFPEYCELEVSRTKKELYKIWLFEKNKITKTFAIIKGIKDYKKGIKGKK